MLNNDTNLSNIQKIGKDELHKVCGGESKTYSVPGMFATGFGDNVDIQELESGGISVSSYCSSGSDSSCSSYSSSMA